MQNLLYLRPVHKLVPSQVTYSWLGAQRLSKFCKLSKIWSPTEVSAQDFARVTVALSVHVRKREEKRQIGKLLGSDCACMLTTVARLLCVRLDNRAWLSMQEVIYGNPKRREFSL